MAITTLGAIALGVGALGGVASSAIGAGASRSAGRAQEAAAQRGIDEQQRQFAEMQRLMAPYVQAGGPALDALLGAAGLSGPESQQAFVSQQEQSPLFQALAQQGENAMLQNASATGGLRGGNLQGALGQFRPALLNQFIGQQYDRLAGITTLGQNAAAGVGSAGINTGRDIAGQYGNIGAAQAGARLGVANSIGQGINMFASGLGTAAMFGGQRGATIPGAPGMAIQPYSTPAGSGSLGYGLSVPQTYIPPFASPPRF